MGWLNSPLMNWLNLKPKVSEEGRLLNYYVEKGYLKPQRIKDLLEKHKQGMSSADILKSLTDDDFVQKGGGQLLSQQAEQAQSKALAQTLMNRLQGQATDLGSQAQQVFPSGPMGPLIGQASIPQNYFLNRLPSQEQNNLALYLQGIGDVNKAPSLLPSLLQPPMPAGQLTPQEQWTQAKVRGLPGLSQEQKQRALYPGALPDYQRPPSANEQMAQIKLERFRGLSPEQQDIELFSSLRNPESVENAPVQLKMLDFKVEDYIQKKIDEETAIPRQQLAEVQRMLALTPDDERYKNLASDYQKQIDSIVKKWRQEEERRKNDLRKTYYANIKRRAGEASPILDLMRPQEEPPDIDWWNAMQKNWSDYNVEESGSPVTSPKAKPQKTWEQY